MEVPACCRLPTAAAPLELLPRVVGMLGVLCGTVMCICARYCVCVAAAMVELYSVVANNKMYRYCLSTGVTRLAY